MKICPSQTIDDAVVGIGYPAAPSIKPNLASETRHQIDVKHGLRIPAPARDDRMQRHRSSACSPRCQRRPLRMSANHSAPVSDSKALDRQLRISVNGSKDLPSQVRVSGVIHGQRRPAGIESYSNAPSRDRREMLRTGPGKRDACRVHRLSGGSPSGKLVIENGHISPPTVPLRKVLS